ncbi:unnamed protein product, partial [Iphiclides podalirius]
MDAFGEKRGRRPICNVRALCRSLSHQLPHSLHMDGVHCRSHFSQRRRDETRSVIAQSADALSAGKNAITRSIGLFASEWFRDAGRRPTGSKKWSEGVVDGRWWDRYHSLGRTHRLTVRVAASLREKSDYKRGQESARRAVQWWNSKRQEEEEEK